MRVSCWDERLPGRGQYDTARTFFQEVLNRSPRYDDAFNASADIEFWAGNNEKSLLIIEEGLTSNPDNVDLLARQARALWIAGKTNQAKKIAEDVLKRAPQHELALDVLQKIKAMKKIVFLFMLVISVDSSRARMEVAWYR